MLTKVEVLNNMGATLVLPLGEAVDGFFIEDIDGLDPGKATLVSSSFATQDGDQYQASHRSARNIVIKVGVEIGARTGSAATLRRTLSSYFRLKTEVRLRFYTDEMDPVDIYGRVESNEWPLFAKEPEATISLLCLTTPSTVNSGPDFFYPTPEVFSSATTSTTAETTLVYEGDVETGFKLTLNVNRSLDEITIYHRNEAGESSSLEFINPLVAGDVLTISTVNGQKGATLNRGGIVSSLLYAISPYANWIKLFPGSNFIRVNAEGAAIPYTLEYTTKFGGL